MMRSGGPELSGAFYIMRCTSNVWEVTAPNPDTTPDPFSLTDQTDVAVSTLIESNTVTITGITGYVNVSVSGAGSPEIRINGGAWVTSGTIQNGQSLEVRLTSDPAFNTMRSATVTVGTASDQWDVTTVLQDITPNAFAFTNQTGVALSTLTTSNAITITGITGDVAVWVSGAGSPQVRVNGGAWVTSGTIQNGQSLEVRLTSNASFSTMNSAIVTVGIINNHWDVTTVAQDTTPDAFSFTDQTGVALSTLTTSNSLNITGITGDVTVSVSGAGSPQVRINGGAWVTSGTIQNGQSLEVRLTSHAAGGTMHSATVTVGTENDQWDVTTEAADCPGIGDVCSDGSVYAGDNIYVTDVNQSTSIQWATVNQNNSGAQSNSDGAANQAWIVANRTLSQYPAFALCENLDRHGHTDWYLPARNELNLLYTHRNAIGGFTTGWYWSSTEYTSNGAWIQRFSDGNQNFTNKTTNVYDVRCVRRTAPGP